jgi:catechol 2,3-dioxygenase-like lactoylglutathione lyase family enzyme
MLHHVSVGVRDVERAALFYDPVLKALGYKRVADFSPGAIAYGETKDHPQFWIGKPHDEGVPNAGNGTHVGFIARSKEAVNAFHDAALKAGGSNGGEPGPRPDYGFAYYGAFIYDLDGNKIEATLYPEEDEITKAARKAVREEFRRVRQAQRTKREERRVAKAPKGGKKKKAKHSERTAAAGPDKAARAERRAKRKARRAKKAKRGE